MIHLTEKQQAVIKADGHLLVTGGPGSGKTTVAILKAAQIADQCLRSGQKILFLSFARATVSRVIEAIEYEQKIPAALKRLIDVETYHAFFGRILKSHGYLVGLPRRLTCLTPSEEAIALSVIRSGFPAKNLTKAQKLAKEKTEKEERLRLAREYGRVCFDLYAPYAGDILHGSQRIRNLVAIMFPVIILDEFQDTNEPQWRVVRALGESGRLIALADPEQRIYDWLGADPARLDHFNAAFTPTKINLGADNHRSGSTEIALFGNDIRTGHFRQSQYNGIVIETFSPALRDPAMTKLVMTIYAARKRLIAQGVKDWSLAVLVPTKKMTRLVSDALRHPPAKLTAIQHSAVIEIEAAILGSEIIAFLMQPSTGDSHLARFIDILCHYFQGKDGEKPTQTALKEADSIRKSYDEYLTRRSIGKSIRSNSILINIMKVYTEVYQLILTGDPENDWKSVRRVMEEGSCSRIKEAAQEARNIRLLDRGTQLRQELARDWLDNGSYRNALAIMKQALIREHFSTSAKPESGVVVMNMHKAKGKQFDEVIIFEGWPIYNKGTLLHNLERIVHFNSMDRADDQTRQNLRVSITRSKYRTTILTPQCDPCVLLP